jgi:hypothetical protein
MSEASNLKNQTQGSHGHQKIPGFLNVLTILTFIGCAINIMAVLYNYFSMENSLKGIEIEGYPIDIPYEVRHSIEKALEIKWIMISLTIIGCALCFYGALLMRKLKKTGFYIYFIGQIISIVGSFILSGHSTEINRANQNLYNTNLGISLVISVSFIIMYAMHLKFLNENVIYTQNTD